MDPSICMETVKDLTTNGLGVDPDAEALVYERPSINSLVPGLFCTGRLSAARVLLRMPSPDLWNGKLMIGATPAVRNEYSLDLLLSDIVIQRGYAYAACDKGTPQLTLRDPSRSMEEWTDIYAQLTDWAASHVESYYGSKAQYIYISGVSNGGYITRRMMELYPHRYHGGVEWEGVLWHTRQRHLLTTLPVMVQSYPIYRNWRGDYSTAERASAFENLIEMGLHPDSEPFWDVYYRVYWLVSLWLYGRNLDPDWKPFAAEWSKDWLENPQFLAEYPWLERLPFFNERIKRIENNGQITKPLLSVAGNYDCLIPFRDHAEAYAKLVESAGASTYHRLYEIDRGNHVDGLLRSHRGKQQPVLPYYEAALMHMECWVEKGFSPPQSGKYEKIEDFAGDIALFSKSSSDSSD
ncbi:alpha/beta hydrolase [Alicyclobacillus sp. TC]|uniref:alpha/beta hydrolase n=1 Tax=Alicyclobacillus sp. TC TaxID=2606450 RepID=UPI0019345D2B|nr:alpha/beta hydrolase [Alicyclobacillus sp. TC]QRF22761.1 alpha/beta hydrolase [Alicyclobacillus sp. TC]